MEFGYRMRQLRKEKGYGLRELARVIKKSPSYLSNIERGAVPPPSAEIVCRIAEVLDGDREELLVLAKRFDVDAFEDIRKNYGRLESAEKTIRFLNSAVSLDPSSGIGSIDNILNMLIGERVLNPEASAITDSFGVLKLVKDIAAAPDDEAKQLGIDLRRDVCCAAFALMLNTLRPYASYPIREEENFMETLLKIFRNYPKEIVLDVVKREELKEAYLESLRKEQV